MQNENILINKKEHHMIENKIKLKNKTISFLGTTLHQIHGFPEYYADKDGNIYSEKGRGKFPSIRKLSPYFTSCGVLAVKIQRNGKYNNFSVVRLIALAFLGAPPSPTSKAKLVMDDMPIMASNVRWL